MLEMLELKTRNNLTSDERKLLEGVLDNLRLNYVDEINKPPTQEKKEEGDAEKEKTG